MLVKEYKNARTFLDDYENVLLENETISRLVLYIAYQHSRVEESVPSLFGVVMQEQASIILFCNIPPHSLVIYSLVQENYLQATTTLADYLGSTHISIQGVVAKPDICQSFMEQYKKNVNCTFTEKMGMDIMEIRGVNEVKPVEGHYRTALSEEVKLVAEWMIEFQLEALTSELDYEAALKKAEQHIGEGNVRFYEDMEHKIVTMAIASRKLAKGTTITYIYTPEEFRGKGYAAANIYYLSKELLEQGNEFCTLFVDKKNPLSNRAYEKVGYKVIGECYEYRAIPI